MPVLKVTVDVGVPHVPNFLRRSDGTTFPIDGLTDEGLREVGKAWTEALVARAQKRRAPEDDHAVTEGGETP